MAKQDWAWIGQDAATVRRFVVIKGRRLIRRGHAKTTRTWQRATSYRARERMFFVGTLVALSFAIVVVVWLGWPLLDTAYLEDESHRLEVVSRVSVFLAAIVTVFTILWRGTIASRQADTQTEAIRRQTDQIELARRQVTATEENNLAVMLQKGAEFLIGNKPVTIAVGIATLRAIATVPNGKYAEAAMDFLSDFLQQHGRHSHEDNLVVAAIDALRAGAAHGRRSARDMVFETDYRPVEAHFWRPVTGVRSCRYRGGHIVLGRDAMFFLTPADFESVGIYGSGHHVDFRVLTIENCQIDGVCVVAVHEIVLSANRWENCCFSGATLLRSRRNLPDLREGGNWYASTNPPVLEDHDGHRRQIDWTKYFQVRTQEID